MLFSPRYTEYDGLAWSYNKYWGPVFASEYYEFIERILLSRLSRGSTLLDLCCGSGQLTARLCASGFRVSAIDGSAALLSYARENAPQADLSTGDARSFTIIEKFDAVLCTYDSLNHVRDIAQLAAVFNNVHASLRKEGRFLFDLKMEEGYKADWKGNSSIVETDHVLAVSSCYDSQRREASITITTFRNEKRWTRSDVTVVEHCYSKDEIIARLTKSMFRNVRTFDSQKDLGKPEIGRLFLM